MSEYIPSIAVRLRQPPPLRRRAGFTLVELLTVIVIIGIILTLVLIASMSSVRSAQEKATQSLLTKLENGINDRIDALMQSRPDPGDTNPITGYATTPGYHLALAHVYGNTTFPQPYPNLASPSLSYRIPDRAYVLAMVDYVKREVPDVYFIQTGLSGTPGNLEYPLNFAANPFPDPNAPVPQAQYVLPIGGGSIYSPGNSAWVFSPGQGIYGASYTAVSGLYKNLGYLAKGYDGVDNTGEGLIDEWQEGVDDSNRAQVLANLRAHTHKTARAEVLYALLVEGSGPLGSVFNRDDFTDKEVMDTDGDGLPEFVDAWGNPLQFYRWPFLYHSPTQHGQRYASGAFVTPYDGVFDEREQNPLDPNQTLMTPSWWASGYNDPVGTNQVYSSGPFPSGFTASTNGWSAGVSAFEFFFHSLHEPMTVPSSGSFGLFWDRGAGAATTGFEHRRSYYSKPLILSWGPDGLPGVFGFFPEVYDNNTSLGTRPNPPSASQLLLIENQAPQFNFAGYPAYPLGTDSVTPWLVDSGADDISNHTLQAGGTGGSAP